MADALTKVDFEGGDGKAGGVESRQNYRDILRQITEQLEKYNDATTEGDFDPSLYTLGEKFADVKERIEEVVEKAETDGLD